LKDRSSGTIRLAQAQPTFETGEKNRNHFPTQRPPGAQTLWSNPLGSGKGCPGAEQRLVAKEKGQKQLGHVWSQRKRGIQK